MTVAQYVPLILVLAFIYACILYIAIVSALAIVRKRKAGLVTGQWGPLTVDGMPVELPARPDTPYHWYKLPTKMPRLMSFAATVPQFENRTKTVTRRLGWSDLRPGDVLEGVDRSPRGGKGFRRLGLIRIVHVIKEPLRSIRVDAETELRLEGFPDMMPKEFIEMFCKMNRCTPATEVNRIEFEYMDGV